MDGVPTKHKVRTSVCFAPTPPFVRAFGEKEAKRQQAAFERPSWVKSACSPTTHEEIPLQVGGALVCGLAGGILFGVVLMLVFFDVRSK